MASKKKAAPAAPQVLRIDGEFSIYRAAELKPLLLQAVEASPVLEVDLSGVAEFDTAGLQLLLLAKRAAADRGHELRLVRHSAVVVDVLQLLDLAAHFGDPLVVAA
ncbi:lipid asymmetry maintenance protein MlaB [Piscinibacter sp. HJYY11]|uniref:STAS domain-containing protein n=1 Tax=Piscinibacter sp. HJYY11 TaxID=2801333 RepID=UPI00191D80CF|nr:STAS domain-containing protein [Piscinibacter sp. HJYY11]MBL0728524.1 STAS domain-containing protein [Piscinibacter sp. HJYY11]